MFLPLDFRRVILVALLCWCVCAPTGAIGQSAQARKDSLLELRRTIDEFKARILWADSARDAREACRQRIMLAPLVKRAEALDLYQAAAQIADTAELVEGEELRAREALVELYRTANDWRQAFAETERVNVLKEEQRASESASFHAESESLRTAASAQSDSLQALLTAERDRSRTEVADAEAHAGRWQLIAILSGALWMFAVAYVLSRFRRTDKRTRAELTALRTELAALKAPQNRFREPVAPVAPPPVEEPVAAPPLPALPDPATVDEALIALFRKRAPERLATLRDARGRGDQEKVLRVLHTLKPQLLAIDEAGAGARCIRLLTEGATADLAAWNSDLDQLERTIEYLLR